MCVGKSIFKYNRNLYISQEKVVTGTVESQTFFSFYIFLNENFFLESSFSCFNENFLMKMC